MMITLDSSPEFSPELSTQLTNRLRPDDKEGEIELYYPKFGGSGEFAGPSLLLLNPE